MGKSLWFEQDGPVRPAEAVAKGRNSMKMRTMGEVSAIEQKKFAKLVATPRASKARPML